VIIRKRENCFITKLSIGKKTCESVTFKIILALFTGYFEDICLGTLLNPVRKKILYKKISEKERKYVHYLLSTQRVFDETRFL
jgi:hypothetical protein